MEELAKLFMNCYAPPVSKKTLDLSPRASLETKAPRGACLSLTLSSLLALPAAAATLFTDFSEFGSTLDTGESNNPTLYSWTVVNHVNSSNSIPITQSGAELAGHFPGHTHPRNWTAEADIVFVPAARPQVAFAELEFFIVERHEFTELGIFVEGRPTSGSFTFSGTGAVRIEFTGISINEYWNGSLQATRTYASLGWSPTDQISTIKFIGLHHDNGSIDRSYIDNVSFTSIPEPGTSVLAFGGLLAMARRRRKSN